MRTLRRSVVILLGILLRASAVTAQGLYPETPPGFDAGKLAEHLAGDEPFHGSMPNGEITLTFLVDTTGRIHDVTTRTSVYLFNHTSIDDLVAGFRMTPATWRGKPVEVEWSIHLRFLTEETDDGMWQHVWVDGEKFSFPPTEESDGAHLMEMFNPTIFLPTTAPTVDTIDLVERIVRAYLSHNHHHAPSSVRATARLLVEPDSSHGPPISLRLDTPTPDSTLWINVLVDALEGVRTVSGMLRDGTTRSVLELPITIEVIGSAEGSRTIVVTLHRTVYTVDLREQSGAEEKLSIDISFP